MPATTKQDLIERIIRIYPGLSPKKRLVADYILSDYKRLFLTTAKALAAICGVSEPTVNRFVNDLGFDGYGEFESYIKGLLHVELTSVERLIKTRPADKRVTTLQAYTDNTVANLENMINTVSAEDVGRLAEIIHRAPEVIVAGYRASAVLAMYFGYLLRKIRGHVYIDTTSSVGAMDHIALSGPDVLLVAICFPRYPERAIQLVKYARKFKCPIIGISDIPRSPIISLSDQFVVLDIEGISFVDPFAHIFTFLGALIHEIAFVDEEATLDRLKRIEAGVKERAEFYSLEDEGIQDYDPLEFPSQELIAPGAFFNRKHD